MFNGKLCDSDGINSLTKFSEDFIPSSPDKFVIDDTAAADDVKFPLFLIEKEGKAVVKLLDGL